MYKGEKKLYSWQNYKCFIHVNENHQTIETNVQFIQLLQSISTSSHVADYNYRPVE